MKCAVLATCGLLASCYNLSPWKGDVVVHPVERKTIAECGTGALTPAGKQRITRDPYLQSTTTTSTKIVWGARTNRGEVVLREPGGPVVARTRAVPVAEDVFRAAFVRLEPTHLYCYQLVEGDVALTQPAPLTTAAAPGRQDPIRFVALGDSGAGSPAQRAIAKRISEVPFDFMLFLGDIAYEDGKPQQLEKIDIDGREIETLRLEHGEKPREHSPIPPEQEIEPDERLHDKPDDDAKQPRLPEQPAPVTRR